MTEAVRQIGNAILPWLASALCGLVLYIGSGLIDKVEAQDGSISEIMRWQSGVDASRYKMSDHVNYAEKVERQFSDVLKLVGDGQRQVLDRLGGLQADVASLKATVETERRTAQAK